MEIKEFTFSVDELELYPEAIEEFMGYKAGHSDETVKELIKDTLIDVENYCNIKGGLVIMDHLTINKQNKSILVNDFELEVKKIIFAQFRKAESIAFFCCTAGEGIGSYSAKMMQQGDLLEAYIIDAIGSEIVETAMDKIQDQIENSLGGEDLYITNRYSPGYCGWDVKEQQKLFSFFPQNFCGITLTEHSLMQPIKSVSGIIGIGKQVRRKDYACNICDMTNCIYRKKKN